MTQSKGKMLTTATIVVLVAALGYFVLTAPDRRTPGEKINDAFNELPKGIDNAARQLEDRTPAEKIADAAKDATN